MTLCRWRSPRRFEGNTALRNVMTHSHDTELHPSKSESSARPLRVPQTSEIRCFLYKPNNHYHTHRSPPESPCPGSDESNLYPRILSLSSTSIYFFLLGLGLQSGFLPFRFPNQNFVCTSVQCLPHAPPPSCFGFCNNTRRVQITKLHIRIFLQLSVTFSKYSPQQPVLEYFHSMFFTHSNTKFHIRTKKKVKSWFCEFQLRSNID